MIIRVRKDAKDRQLGPKHRTYSRREFIQRGLFTTTMAATLPAAIADDLLARAARASGMSSCPAATSIPGGIAQIHGPGGGFSIASYNLNQQQMQMASNTTSGANALSLWGITGGSNLAAIFANGAGVDSTSPYGATLMTPPPGVTPGTIGQATPNTWFGALAQVSYAGNYGAASQDDGAGDNLGHPGGVGPYRISGLNTDLSINNQVTVANWAAGFPTDKVSTSPTNLTSTSLAGGFGITPAANTNSTLWTNTAAAGASLGSLFSSIFGVTSNGTARSGATTGLTAAGCGFQSDSLMASTTFGTNLFTPANISAITGSSVFGGAGSTSVTTLSSEEQAFLAAYYQSTIGELGAIFSSNSGADYHNQSVQTDISPYDQNIAVQVRMWLLAAMIANQPSALIITTNGSPGPQGTQNVTINGVSGGATTITVNGPNAQGDDGGSFSKHDLLLFTPFGQTPPVLNSTGTISSSGTTTVSSSITSVPQSVGSLYYTAMQFLASFNPSAFNVAGFEAKMTSAGDTPISLLG